jgi:hypothetical protein
MKFEELNIIERSETKEVPLDELKLDPDNVRLQHIRIKYGNMTEEDIKEHFWAEPSTRDLYRQILAAKGLYQEIIIDSMGIVREGNRRLVCLRKLKEEAHEGKLPGIPKTFFDKIKCIVLPKDTTDRELSLMLASIHVKGKKAWDAFDKARHITHLHDELKVSYDILSKTLNMGKITIIRAVDAYNTTRKYGEKYPEDADWYRMFTYFDELYKRKSLKDWRNNPSHLELFLELVHEGKFRDVRDVRFLDRVLKDEDAMRALDRGKFEDALKVACSKDPSIEDNKFRKIRDTIDTIRSFSRKDIKEIINDRSRKNMLQQLMNEIRIFLSDIEAIEKSIKKSGEEV